MHLTGRLIKNFLKFSYANYIEIEDKKNRHNWIRNSNLKHENPNFAAKFERPKTTRQDNTKNNTNVS